MLGSELFLFEKNFWRLATFFLEFQNSSDDVGEQAQANVSDEHVKEISNVYIKIHLPFSITIPINKTVNPVKTSRTILLKLVKMYFSLGVFVIADN